MLAAPDSQQVAEDAGVPARLADSGPASGAQKNRLKRVP
jgi:hypothetical protein